MKVKYFTNNKIDKNISKMNTFFANLQYWQYKAGQEKSACHFHKKRLAVTLLVKRYT